MYELTGKNFGLVIAYILPGFTALWGLAAISETVAKWLAPAPTFPAGLNSVFFVTLASLIAGMTVAAARWAVVDSMHHQTGLLRPIWDDTQLQSRLAAFEAVVEAHYRHYQFYANMAVAFPFAGLTQWAIRLNFDSIWLLAIVVIELLFLATSRDTLRKYYSRTTMLLNSSPVTERSVVMSNGHKPPKKPDQPKPSPDDQKQSAASGK